MAGNGSRNKPFDKIGEASFIAKAGDEIVVAPGIYREHVDPKNSGTKSNPIKYRSEIPGKAIISGAEQISDWRHYKDDVWAARISNELFGDYNPYTQILQGDWYYSVMPLHAGEIYFNGKSMYEVEKLEHVIDVQQYTSSWDQAFSKYQWCTCQEEDTTLIYGNFQGNNPNEHAVEINVRRNCFYPTRTGVNYITVSGFVIKQAATTWAPPTAYQEGMVGPHWSKGWIIEECEISDSKCVGICLGKYLQPANENKWTFKRLKHGTQTEREAVCQAQLEGWSKENIGSHTVRRCNIHDCEQAGIAGHLGGAFSVIEDNHIHHINNKQQLIGAEIAGIKLHAAIDTLLIRNHIHHCTRGIWLDWQAQGTRISKNVLHDNMPPLDIREIHLPMCIGEDLFIEVSHGPTLVDDNFLLSSASCRLAAQGVAFVHNLICGSFTSIGDGTNNSGGVEAKVNRESAVSEDMTARYTPYHLPHSTQIAGFMTILHGDVRFYNNIFIQNYPLDNYKDIYKMAGSKPLNAVVGTAPFNGFPTEEEYLKLFFSGSDWGGTEDREKYYLPLPVYTGGNVYFNGAQPQENEIKFIVDTKSTVHVEVIEKEGGYHIRTDIYKYIPAFETPFVSTELLGTALEPEQKFENPDGSLIFLCNDYKGKRRGIRPLSGPIENPDDWKNL